MDIKQFEVTLNTLNDVVNTITSQDFKYQVKVLQECYTFLMDTYCRFKVGDRVMLKETPDINMEDSWGWMGAKHFLIKGAAGTVHNANCSGEGFRFGVIFDDESWINSSTKEIVPITKTEDRHIYGFGDRWLEPWDGRVENTIEKKRSLERTCNVYPPLEKM